MGIPHTAGEGIPRLEPRYTHRIPSPLKWVGGKSKMARAIVSRIPAHKTYIEPFAGALHVLFSKPPSPVEIANDLNDNLVNLWRTIRRDPYRFECYLNDLLISETLFNEFSVHLGYTPSSSSRYTMKDLNGIPNPESEGGRGIPSGYPGIPPQAAEGIPFIDRACKYYYLIRCAFNGNVSDNPAFTHGPGKPVNLTREWSQIAHRIKNVVFRCRDYREIFNTYDTPESFFYIDPPYLLTTEKTGYYEYQLSKMDHTELSAILHNLKGKYILSMENTPLARSVYLQDITVYHEVMNVPYTDNGELLIMNYEPPDPPFYCREGIPITPGYTFQNNHPGQSGIPRLEHRYTKPGPAPYTVPNCPRCHSRNVQTIYTRHTIKATGSRTFRKTGLMCMDCKETLPGAIPR